MNMRIAYMVIVLLFASGVSADAETPERFIWDKKPIKLSLKVDQERIIHFPGHIKYWLPDAIKPFVKVLSANGVLYISANNPFETIRVRVQELEVNRIYLLDIKGVETGDYKQEVIIINQEDVVNQSQQVKNTAKQEDWYSRLTRFAAQRLYAPVSAMESDAGIQPVKLKYKTPVRLIKGGAIEATPWAAWQGGGYYITAVRLRNISNQKQEIDPRKDIRGHWLVAIFQHSWLDTQAAYQILDKTGQDKDTTTLYLISTRRFEDVFNG